MYIKLIFTLSKAISHLIFFIPVNNSQSSHVHSVEDWRSYWPLSLIFTFNLWAYLIGCVSKYIMHLETFSTPLSFLQVTIICNHRSSTICDFFFFTYVPFSVRGRQNDSYKISVRKWGLKKISPPKTMFLCGVYY